MPARFGALFFDDPHILSRGSVCTGEGRAFRLGRDGIAGLDSTTTWLTNLSYDDALTAGLTGNCRFRMNTYLRERIGRLCEEYGRTSQEEQTEAASMLFTRTMKICSQLFKRPSFNPEGALKKGFREFLGATTDDLLSMAQADKLAAALRYSASCQTEYLGGGQLYLRMPPRAHCLSVLAAPIPVGEMVRIPRKKIPPASASAQEKQKWFSMTTDGGSMPGLFRVTCRNFRPDFYAFINFGDGNRRPDRALCDERQWVTSPELISLLVFSDVCIHEAWIAERTRRMNRAREFAAALPPWTVLSMTMNIVFDNIWTGMTVLRRGGASPSADQGKISVSAAVPFLRAQDLQLLFEKAWAVSKTGSGLSVRGYASGSIRIAEKDADPADVWNACIEEGLLPPFLHIPREDLPDPFHKCGNLGDFFKTVEERPDLALRTVQILRASDSWDMLEALDAFVLKKLEERLAAPAEGAGGAGIKGG